MTDLMLDPCLATLETKFRALLVEDPIEGEVPQHFSFNLSLNPDLLYLSRLTADIDLSSQDRESVPSCYGPADTRRYPGRTFPSPGRWFAYAMWRGSPTCPESLSCHQPTRCAILRFTPDPELFPH